MAVRISATTAMFGDASNHDEIVFVAEDLVVSEGEINAERTRAAVVINLEVSKAIGIVARHLAIERKLLERLLGNDD